jgi:hypothetical protein
VLKPKEVTAMLEVGAVMSRVMEIYNHQTFCGRDVQGTQSDQNFSYGDSFSKDL